MPVFNLIICCSSFLKDSLFVVVSVLFVCLFFVGFCFVFRLLLLLFIFIFYFFIIYLFIKFNNNYYYFLFFYFFFLVGVVRNHISNT